MNFKNFTTSLALAAAAALALTQSALATLPTYGTASGYGNTSSNASVVIPANPNGQVRIVTVYYTSDNAAGGMNFSTGVTSYGEDFTNTSATSLTNYVGSTNGLTVGSVVLLQHNGQCLTNVLVSYGNTGTAGWTNANGIVLTNLNTTYGYLGQGYAGYPATNVSYIVTGSGGFGILPSIGDNIWQMSAPTTVLVGIGTNEMSGDDVYSGNYGCPVAVWLGPVTATNRLSTVSWHYDSASQP
jgi:hypothetical protein